MVDSVVTWAREYKVDGFRFDLMGHHSKANMLTVRRALDALTLRARRRRRPADLPLRRGLELRRGRRRRPVRPGDPAQHGRHGIGTFSDRLRDAVRGGGPFDEDPRIQGFASGLFTDPNGIAGERDAERAARAAACHRSRASGNSWSTAACSTTCRSI